MSFIPPPFGSLLRLVALAGLGAASAFELNATTLTYNDFSDTTGLKLNGSTASITSATTGFNSPLDGKVLRLTDNLGQGGSAFSLTSIPLQNQNSFSTYFSFRISDPQGISDGDGVGADGLTFTVQTQSNNVGGGGGGIGYQGISPSVGIEFDTYDNGGVDGNNGNHVGIDINGSLNSVARANIGQRMNDGNLWYSWIDYNGATDLLEVRLSQTNLRPVASTLFYTVDLQSVLGANASAYVGFTSGTGSASGDHDIVSWQFNDTYQPIATPDSASTAGLLSLGFGLLLCGRKLRAKIQR